jgi:hypothetical protein
MKKIMTLIILVGLLVLGATSVLAATVYFDYMPGGTVEGSNSKGSSSPDCSDYQVGVVVPVEKFQFGLEYNSTDIDDDTSMQFTGWKITGGYQCFKTDQFELLTNLSYLYWKAEDEGEGSTTFKYSPPLIGIACKYRMNDQTFISGSVDCATSDFVIEEDESEAYPADYTTAQLKYSYFITKGFAASLGYKWSKLKYEGKLQPEFVTKGFTLGASYNF